MNNDEIIDFVPNYIKMCLEIHMSMATMTFQQGQLAICVRFITDSLLSAGRIIGAISEHFRFMQDFSAFDFLRFSLDFSHDSIVSP